VTGGWLGAEVRLLNREPRKADILIAAIGFVPIAFRSLQGCCCLTANLELWQMGSLAKAGDQITHGNLPV
jgi:hypothetical protein